MMIVNECVHIYRPTKLPDEVSKGLPYAVVVGLLCLVGLFYYEKYVEISWKEFCTDFLERGVVSSDCIIS